MIISFRAAALLLLSILMLPTLVTADEGENVCQNKKWTGSYIQSIYSEVTGTYYIYRWNFDRDGTLIASLSGAPDDAANSGTVTPILGSWECREDGKILATYSYAQYQANWSLFRHIRMTALVTIPDDNTLRRTEFVARIYFPGEDVSDPNGGFKVVNKAAPGWELTRLSPAEEDVQDLL